MAGVKKQKRISVVSSQFRASRPDLNEDVEEPVHVGCHAREDAIFRHTENLTSFS